MSNCSEPHGRPFGCLRHASAAALPAALLASVLGCGAGEYQSRVQARVQEMATGSEFAGLYAAQTLGDRPVSVRVPQVFTSPPLVPGAEVAGEGAPPATERVQPGVVDLPGLTYTYEDFVADAEGGRIPFYLHVGAANTTHRAFRDPTNRWVHQIKSRLPDQDPSWERVECDTPDGRFLVWQRLRAEGEQPFSYVSQDGRRRVVELPGILEIYYRVEGDWAITLVWRVPSSIAPHVGLERWAPMVAGTVSLAGQTEPAGAPMH